MEVAGGPPEELDGGAGASAEASRGGLYPTLLQRPS